MAEPPKFARVTKIRELTARPRRAGMKDIREVIADLNPVLRGWCNYFRTGNASISIAGSGSVNGHATGSADVSIMGSGDVRISGGAKCNVSKMGSGEVHCS